ncbi:aldo/keto reductase [Sphingomonas bacterium]|uniref:aldo/keto reductase n=1 Tax=Sphingomonas bacterium TaxID=1895847 RepID=UPI0020C688B9|nr:aldo/keto reductase [Sphingomonas bacterium]
MAALDASLRRLDACGRRLQMHAAPDDRARLGPVDAAREPPARLFAAALDAWATEVGVGRAAVAYSWIMAHPARAIPIVGTQNAARIAELADALKVE